MSEAADAWAKALENMITWKERQRAEHPLTYLFWESTLRCNLFCRHCGSDCLRDDSTADRELAGEVICAELDAIAREYDPGGITFAIIGGEPLVRRDIDAVGAHAAALGYNWGITTNAMLLDEKRLASLKAAGLTSIAVSLDGLAAQHDALRRRPGAFLRVSDALRRLVADPFWRAFDVICCVSRINIDHLGPFVDYLAGLGVPGVRLTPVFSRGRADAESGLMLSGEQTRQLLAFVATQRASRKDIDVTLSEEGYWGPNWECRIRESFHYCGSGINIGSILYDGQVTGCPSVSRRFVQGHLRDAPFLGIWNNAFTLFRQRETVALPRCRACAHWDLCKGGGCHLFDPVDSDVETCSLRKIGELWE
ncbi:Radical SAM protein [Rhodovastum atsumiense]|nr:radical SAM protein [Rhodovastum atsumiense]CAH2600991.1 Radical SAM protein [Rhodovastum atsumiense]